MKPAYGRRFPEGVQQDETSRKELESKLKDEQQRLLSTPRKFKKSEKLKLLRLLHVLMVLHTLVGLGIMITGLVSAAVLFTGSTVTGTITNLHVIKDSEGNSYEVNYDYNFKNQLYHASGRTIQSCYRNMTIGGSVIAKVMPPFPTLLLDGNAPFPGICFIFGFGLAWTILMLVPIDQLYIQPYRRTKVMMNGKLCLGKITDKSVSGEDNDLYAISFQYEPSPGDYRTNRRDVSKDQFNVAKMGETVSVLYDPEHLSDSLMYRYSDYELTQ